MPAYACSHFCFLRRQHIYSCDFQTCNDICCSTNIHPYMQLPEPDVKPTDHEISVESEFDKNNHRLWCLFKTDVLAGWCAFETNIKQSCEGSKPSSVVSEIIGAD